MFASCPLRAKTFTIRAVTGVGKLVRFQHCPRNGKSASQTMHLSVTTGNLDFWEGERDNFGYCPGCLMSPETGLLPGHSTQRRVAVGNWATRALHCCGLRLSFSIELAALRVSIMENSIETF